MIDIPLNANVERVDGPGGQSSYVVIDPTTEQVTHFVIKENGSHRTERLVPVDWVVETTPDLICLYCTQDELATLEPFAETHLIWQERPRYDQACWYGVSSYVVPEETAKADEALSALKRLEKEGVIVGGNTAVLIKDQHSKVFLKETEDVDAKHGALFGAIAGGLIGLVSGPAGAIVGAAAGAVTGGIAARRIDMGFPSAYLKNLQQGLQPGCSAIVALVKHESVEKVAQDLAEFQGQLFRRTLTEEVMEWLAAATVAKKGIDKVATY